jgi:integrase/recombinase XerD
VDRRTQRLLDAWLAERPSPNTQAAYRRDLTTFFAWCALTGREPFSVLGSDLERYRDACLEDGASVATVARRLSGIASFFRHAAAQDALRDDPMAGVDRPTLANPAESSVLDAAEVDSLVGAAFGLGAKTAALVTLLALDGMKLGETLNLDVGDVRVGQRAAWVSVQRRGRRQQLRLSPQASEAIARYVSQRRSGPLFLGESAVAHQPSRLTRFGADFIIKRASVAARIDKTVSANVLRRSYIGVAYEAGTPLEEISRHIGHRELRDTARFIAGGR